MKKIISLFITLVCIGFYRDLHSQPKTNYNVRNNQAWLQRHLGDGEALKEMSIIMISKADYDKTIEYAGQLLSLGERTNNDEYRMYASIYLGQALTMKRAADSALYYLNLSLKLAVELKKDSALCSVYNGLGLYASNIETDYYKSISYFFKGIETAKKCNYQRLYSILLCNISLMYYLKNDPVGLKYSLECYDLGHSNEDAYLVFAGSASAAHIYLILRNYDEALKYIKEAEFTMIENKFNDQASIYSLYGNIVSKMGDDKSAIEYFEKALTYKDLSQVSSVVYTYLSYADVLIGRQQYHQAIQLLNTGIKISEDDKNAMLLADSYRSLSLSHEMLADNGNALRYYKIYHHHSDSVFNMDKERSLNELRVQYDTQKHENDVKQSKLELMQNQKKVQMMIFILGFTLLLLGGVYYLYRRKNRFFIQIVKQNQDAIKREIKLEDQIRTLSLGQSIEAANEKYYSSSLSDKKNIQLYEKIDDLMRKGLVYRKKDLTKERLADMLDTNRTYLSQVINEHYGQSFTHYINSFRIEEATRTLSDAANDIPLKALASNLGYNSITTFYNSFQAAIGMTPAQYRDSVIKIKKKEGHRGV